MYGKPSPGSVTVVSSVRVSVNVSAETHNMISRALSVVRFHPRVNVYNVCVSC